MRIDTSQTLDTHDAEHFLLALAAAKEARSLTGNDIDRLCFFPLGTTNALLRKERVVHLRYVQRYCKDLDMPPDKPWGIWTCQYCPSVAASNGATPPVSGVEAPATAHIREGLLRMIKECVLLFAYVEGVEGVAHAEVTPITVLWQEMSTDARKRFLREVLSEQEQYEVADQFLTDTHPLNLLFWGWPALSTDDRIHFLHEMLTPNEYRALQYGMKKDDPDAHHPATL